MTLARSTREERPVNTRKPPVPRADTDRTASGAACAQISAVRYQFVTPFATAGKADGPDVPTRFWCRDPRHDAAGAYGSLPRFPAVSPQRSGRHDPRRSSFLPAPRAPGNRASVRTGDPSRDRTTASSDAIPFDMTRAINEEEWGTTRKLQ